MTSKIDQLATKTRKVVDELHALRKENERLRSDCESLKSQVALTAGDNRKAQRILAEYDQLKRNHEQTTVRVARALNKLATLRI